MLSYPIHIENDGASLLVTSIDFSELTTFGYDRAEAQARTLDALQEAIAARIHDRRDIPLPPPAATYSSPYPPSLRLR